MFTVSIINFCYYFFDVLVYKAPFTSGHLNRLGFAGLNMSLRFFTVETLIILGFSTCISLLGLPPRSRRSIGPSWYNKDNEPGDGGMSVDKPLAELVSERAAALERYNAWEKTQTKLDDRDLGARMAWLEEAYGLAREMGALNPLPETEEGLLHKCAGVVLMHERLSLLCINKGHV